MATSHSAKTIGKTAGPRVPDPMLLAGVQIMQTLLAQFEAMPEVLRDGMRWWQDDSTEYNIPAARAALEATLRTLGERADTAEREGFMRALAWVLLLNSKGFGVCADDMKAEHVLAEYDNAVNGSPRGPGEGQRTEARHG